MRFSLRKGRRGITRLAESTKILKARLTPLSPHLPHIHRGSSAADRGILSRITATEAQRIRESDPIAAQFLRPIVSDKSVLSESKTWCLWLEGVDRSVIKSSRELSRRVEQVERVRLSSKTKSTQDGAERGNEFQDIRQPNTDYLAIPLSLGDDHEYIPVASFRPDVVAHYTLGVIDTDHLFAFGVVSCKIFRYWKRNAGTRFSGQTKAGFSPIYNAFPLPAPTTEQKQRVEKGARGVLLSRQYFLGNTLEELYSARMKPSQLKQSHIELNHSVYPIFDLPVAATENEVIARLFELYEQMSLQ